MHFRAKHYDKPSSRPISKSPKYTTDELADLFGISTASLAAYIGHDPKAPKPTGYANSNLGHSRKTYYDLAEMKAWWKAKQST